MKFVKNVFVRQKSASILFSLVCLSISLSLSSCDEKFNYSNPFDSNIAVLPPTDLNIDSISGASVSLSWKNNFAITGQSQASQVQTVVMYEYSRDSLYYQVPAYLPVDTVRGVNSSVTISRVFETSKGSSSFYIYTILGSKTTDPSNTVSTIMFNSSYVLGGLAATLISKTSCRLAWRDSSKSGLYFRIERKLVASDSFTLLVQSPANTSSFVDSTINYEGDRIYYRICAVFQNGLNSPYDTASIYIPLAAPSLNEASSINYSSVSLSWTNNVPFGDGFIVERAEKNGSFMEIGRVPANVNSYTDVSPDTTKEYIYRVKLFAGTNISDPSNSSDLGFWPMPKYVRGISGSYGKMAVSPDYSLIALTENNGGDITIVNSADLQVLAQFHDANLTAMSVDICASNQYLVAGFVDHTQNTGCIKIWRLSDGSLYREWDRSNPVDAVRFSPDGSLLAADGYSGATVHVPPSLDLPGSVSITDIKKDSVISAVYGENVIAFSPNQATIATGGEGFFEWNPLDGSLRASAWPSGTYQLKFFNDGTRIVCGGRSGIFVEGSSNTEISFPYFVSSLDITPDNDFVVVLGEYVPIIIKVKGWIVVNSTTLKSSYNSLSCLPNGRLIIAGPSGLSEYQLENQWESPVTSN